MNIKWMREFDNDFARELPINRQRVLFFIDKLIRKERLDAWKNAREQYKFDLKIQEDRIKYLEEIEKNKNV